MRELRPVRRLRLKLEQRILALTIVKVRGKERFLLGVVYRGSRWLDGIIFEQIGRKRAAGITKIVRDSAYYKELRYIILQGRFPVFFDGSRLHAELDLPVIAMRLRGRKRRVKSWGLEKGQAEEILTAFTVNRAEPDAVFLADRLRSALELLP